ncbi:hypothetical protein [Phycicoccus sp.]|uniref:hypothetical protein n=1 Tax=Phycicoccus sp. TaxID=1902410 RepID=UPI002C24E970|nr:hypothetical protein [Phycicoccus sp.]HMM94921.1 hypothetical protein [Phycicoccus sp.]
MATRRTPPEGEPSDPTEPIDPARPESAPPAAEGVTPPTTPPSAEGAPPPASAEGAAPPPQAGPPAGPGMDPHWSAAAASAAPAPPPGWAPPPRRPGAVRRAWGEATATSGGRVALAVVAVLATLLVVAVIGLGAALVGSHVGHSGPVAGREGGPGRWFGPDRGGQGDRGGPGRDRSDDGAPGQGPWGQGRPGMPGGPGGFGNGPGGGPGGGAATGGLGGLGGVLHGEFTTSASGSPVVMVVQVGEVTAYTQSKSVTVKSSDGFEATYDLTGPVASSRIGLPLEVGAQVRVVAAKQGLKATRLNVVG